MKALRSPLLVVSVLVVISGLALAQDAYCPSYPVAVRASDNEAIDADAAYASYDPADVYAVIPPVKNVIDAGIFKKMSADGVDAAPLTTDGEFVRRIYLDLNGRIPTYEQAESFLANPSSNKRAELIDALLASPAYVDQISHWFLERFQVRATGQRMISLPAAINFYDFIREFIAKDRPYDAVVREMLTAQGDSDNVAPMALLIRQVEENASGPRQDAWDNITNMATTQFLGVRTECISCHSGRGHLEKINVDLSVHSRRDFWRMSAFFSRLRLQRVQDDQVSFRPRLILSDMSVGLYTAVIDPSNPGGRPSRDSAYEEPYYWLTGQKAASGAWRGEFGKILTSDRQFAKASVNYLWAYFFGSGIVDPPDGWDLARTDPSAPLPDGWTTQNTHPDVLDALADHFIRNNYSIKSVVKLIVNSNTYQLSSHYTDGRWQDVFKRYFARYEPRRLSAEQLVDSVATASGVNSQMAVAGLSDVLSYTNQIPYPNASNDFNTENILTSLGRGDYLSRPSLNKPSLYGVLEFMNNWVIEVRTRAFSDRYAPQSLLSKWIAEGLTEDAVVRRMFMSTLTRPPTAEELRLALDRKQVDVRSWFSGLQWALFQKTDFVFNY